MVDTDEVYSFSQKKNSLKSEVKKGAGEYVPLQKIVGFIKLDFNRQTTKLRELLERENIHDAPILQLMFVDVRKKENNKFMEFMYSPSFVLEKL